MWLRQSAEMNSAWKGKRIGRHLSYCSYALFAGNQKREEENVPQGRGVGNDGHGEKDDALDGYGDMVDITSHGKSRGDRQKKNRGHGDARHVGPKISVLVHRSLPLTIDRAMPEWH